MRIDYKIYEPEDNPFDLLLADITHRCNMECANCYIPNRHIPDMDVGKLYEFLKRLPDKTTIRLIGAEPTVRKDLPDIITNVKKCGHRVSLTTNGLKLSSLKYLQSLKNAGLRSVLLSMNGADNEEIYEKLDNGKEYCEPKLKALKNCMSENMLINTGTIIVKGVNEFSLKDQVDLVRQYMKETGYRSRLKPLLRFKSVGNIGRNMGQYVSYSVEEIEDIMFSTLNEKIEKVDASVTSNSASDKNYYQLDDLYIRIVDWQVDDDGVPDRGNERRGRITQDFKTAPHFEHAKDNEFGY